MQYDLLIDDHSDESDTDFNNLFSREASDDESERLQVFLEPRGSECQEFEENVVSFTLEINDRSKIEINYITLISDSED